MSPTKLIAIVTLLIALPFTSASAANEKDFLGIMMPQITSQQTTYPVADYKIVTVSPTMIKLLLKKLSDSSTDLNFNGKQEVLATLLKSVNSLRLLSASKHPEAYETLARRLLADNKAIYKPFKNTKAPNNTSQIWTRKSGNRVVEIVMTDTSHGDLQILDFTGNFNKDFMRILMQMQ